MLIAVSVPPPARSDSGLSVPEGPEAQHSPLIQLQGGPIYLLFLVLMLISS